MPRPRLVCVTCLHHVTKGSSHPSSIVKSIASTATSMKGITMSREDVAPRWSTTVRKARSPSAQFAKITAGRSCCGSAKVSSLLLSPLWPSALPGNWQSTCASDIANLSDWSSAERRYSRRMSSKWRYRRSLGMVDTSRQGSSTMDILKQLNFTSNLKVEPPTTASVVLELPPPPPAVLPAPLSCLCGKANTDKAGAVEEGLDETEAEGDWSTSDSNVFGPTREITSAKS
mmetsp:Transcript_23356/g.58091  ORF Transcript_23356/g.58091 Transcript_23356/m.58091 type:complete len:230 (-) Transcript_23356:4073-4762(-)